MLQSNRFLRFAFAVLIQAIPALALAGVPADQVRATADFDELLQKLRGKNFDSPGGKSKHRGVTAKG